MNKSLLDHFSCLSDPRQSWKVIYPLNEVLLIVLCATMAGADDFVEIEQWSNNKIDFLRRFLPFEKGFPSHDTLNDVINALPADDFSDCFISWWTHCVKVSQTLLPLTARPPEGRITKAKVKIRFTLSLHGLRANGWFSGKRHVLKNQMKLLPSQPYWNDWS